MDKAVDLASISVVIPVYNGEESIERALESIRKQTKFEYIKEIIVVNDGSTDQTSQIIEQYSQNFPSLPISLINQNNGGVSSARNKGMSEAQGKWIALLDSDDEWFEDKIERQVAILQSHPEIFLLGGDFQPKPISILGRKITGLHRAKVEEICIVNFPQPSTAIFQRRVFEEIGGYDVTRSYAEDGQYFLKICNLYNCYYQSGQVVFYARGKRGFGASGLSANMKAMHQGNLQNFKELYDDKIISKQFYYFIIIFARVKYLRRILISWIRQKKNS